MGARTGGLILEMKRVLRAPRERIFSALIEPAELAQWWGPRGFTTPEVQVDPRVAGRYRLTMQPPDADPFHLSGEFLEVDPPGRLAYTFRWEEPHPDDRETVVTLTLSDIQGSTEVSLSQSGFTTQARRALHKSGWSDSFDKLAEFMEASR